MSTPEAIAEDQLDRPPTAWWKPALGVVLPIVLVVPIVVGSIYGGIILGMSLEYGGPVVGAVLLIARGFVLTVGARPSERARRETRDALIEGFGTARQRFHLVLVGLLLVLLAPALGLVLETVRQHLDGYGRPGWLTDPFFLATAIPALGLGPMLIVADVLWAVNPHWTWVENDALREGRGRPALIRFHRRSSWIVGVACVLVPATFWLLPLT